VLEVANGESIGMMAIREGGRERFIEGLDQLVRMPEKRNAFYLEIFQRLIDSGYLIGFSEFDPDDWAEIDFHPDPELIRTNIERFGDKITSWADRARGPVRRSLSSPASRRSVARRPRAAAAGCRPSGPASPSRTRCAASCRDRASPTGRAS